MAGSVGNVVNIADLLKRHTAETVRFLLLSTHYRSPIEYSEERLDEVKRSLDGFYRFFERYERIAGEPFHAAGPTLPDAVGGSVAFTTRLRPLVDRFFECMDDDFNTGGAVGTLFELLGVLNRFADENRLDTEKPYPGTEEFETGVATLRALSTILGLFWEPPAKASLGGDDALVAGLMQLLIDVRNNLRTDAKAAAKDNPLKKPLFDQTDLIRKRLGELKVTLEDRPGGTTWRVG